MLYIKTITLSLLYFLIGNSRIQKDFRWTKITPLTYSKRILITKSSSTMTLIIKTAPKTLSMLKRLPTAPSIKPYPTKREYFKTIKILFNRLTQNILKSILLLKTPSRKKTCAMAIFLMFKKLKKSELRPRIIVNTFLYITLKPSVRGNTDLFVEKKAPNKSSKKWSKNKSKKGKNGNKMANQAISISKQFNHHTIPTTLNL